MPFRRRVFAEILADMIEHVRLNTPLSDFRVGSVIRTLLEAAALEDDECYFQMARLLADYSFTSATGADLDRRLADFDLVRQGAEPALGQLVITAPAPVRTNTPLRAGLVAYCDETPQHPRVEFVTTRDGVIVAGATSSAPVPLVATVPGAFTNVPAGRINFLRAPVPGLEGATCTNPVSAAGGRDAESDDELRARARRHLRSLPRGTVHALEGKVVGIRALGPGGEIVGQVASALLREERPGESTLFILDGTNRYAQATETLPAPERLTHAATPGQQHLRASHVPVVPATFGLDIRTPGVAAPLRLELRDPAASEHVELDDTTGAVTIRTLPGDHAHRDGLGLPAPGLAAGARVSATYAHYTGLVAEVQRVVNGDPADPVRYPGWKAAGTRVRVRYPVVREIGVCVAITPKEGHARVDLAAAVAAAVEQHVNALPLSAEVIAARILALAMSVPGVLDARLLQPSGNLAALEDEIIRVPLGGVVVS